jgi:FAD/FMN-containing dehydrogenase
MTKEIRFADAIQLTQNFVSQLGNQQLAAAQITDFVANLVATTEGARGFFVGYLTSESTIPDSHHPALLEGLAAHREVVADLLVKNLAMSTAQALHFQRQQQPDMAANSRIVADRSRQLITQLNWPEIQALCRHLDYSITQREGVYTEFLTRWGYDLEQMQAIQRIVNELDPNTN